jgi:hypothetical protein
MTHKLPKRGERAKKNRKIKPSRKGCDSAFNEALTTIEIKYADDFKRNRDGSFALERGVTYIITSPLGGK